MSQRKAEARKRLRQICQRKEEKGRREPKQAQSTSISLSQARVRIEEKRRRSQRASK